MREAKRRLASLEQTAGDGQVRYVFAWGDAPVDVEEGERVVVIRFVYEDEGRTNETVPEAA